MRFALTSGLLALTSVTALAAPVHDGMVVSRQSNGSGSSGSGSSGSDTGSTGSELTSLLGEALEAAGTAASSLGYSELGSVMSAAGEEISKLNL